MTEIRFDLDEIPHDSCQICGGCTSLLFNKIGGTTVFGIFECEECGFAFVNPTPSYELVKEFYSQVGHGENSLRSVEAVLEEETEEPNAVVDAARIARNLKEMTIGRDLLDVGCGYGLFALEARRNGFSVAAIEIADVERGIARELLGFTPICTSLEEFKPSKTFDAIILSQVLEHAREPVKWMQKIREMLSPNGVAAVALPNFRSLITDILKDRDPYVTPPAHLNYFAAENLIRLANSTGFTVLKLETLTRIRKRAFIRRFGRRPGAALHRAFSATTPLLDLVRKGNMLNIYIGRRA